jgi:hypothetical protein
MSMEQTFCNTLIVVKGTKGEGYNDFTRRMRAYAETLARRDDVAFCKLAVTAGPPPKFSVIPYKKGPAALITLRSREAGAFRGETCREMTVGIDGLIGCYRGDCALPVAYEKDWADGECTPGAGLLTLFRKRRDIDDETFIERWHNGHTPLSLEIHPLWNYARNVVTEQSVDGSRHYDGIVEEHFRTKKDLTGLARFFGGFGKMVKNMAAVYKDMNGFIDRKTIEPYFITEYWILYSGAPRETSSLKN